MYYRVVWLSKRLPLEIPFGLLSRSGFVRSIPIPPFTDHPLIRFSPLHVLLPYNKCGQVSSSVAIYPIRVFSSVPVNGSRGEWTLNR